MPTETLEEQESPEKGKKIRAGHDGVHLRKDRGWSSRSKIGEIYLKSNTKKSETIDVVREEPAEEKISSRGRSGRSRRGKAKKQKQTFCLAEWFTKENLGSKDQVTLEKKKQVGWTGRGLEGRKPPRSK